MKQRAPSKRQKIEVETEEEAACLEVDEDVKEAVEEEETEGEEEGNVSARNVGPMTHGLGATSVSGGSTLLAQNKKTLKTCLNVNFAHFNLQTPFLMNLAVSYY